MFLIFPLWVLNTNVPVSFNHLIKNAKIKTRKCKTCKCEACRSTQSLLEKGKEKATNKEQGMHSKRSHSSFSCGFSLCSRSHSFRAICLIHAIKSCLFRFIAMRHKQVFGTFPVFRFGSTRTRASLDVVSTRITPEATAFLRFFLFV